MPVCRSTGIRWAFDFVAYRGLLRPCRSQSRSLSLSPSLPICHLSKLFIFTRRTYIVSTELKPCGIQTITTPSHHCCPAIMLMLWHSVFYTHIYYILYMLRQCKINQTNPVYENWAWTWNDHKMRAHTHKTLIAIPLMMLLIFACENDHKNNRLGHTHKHTNITQIQKEKKKREFIMQQKCSRRDHFAFSRLSIMQSVCKLSNFYPACIRCAYLKCSTYDYEYA